MGSRTLRNQTGSTVLRFGIYPPIRHRHSIARGTLQLQERPRIPMGDSGYKLTTTATGRSTMYNSGQTIRLLVIPLGHYLRIMVVVFASDRRAICSNVRP